MSNSEQVVHINSINSYLIDVQYVKASNQTTIAHVLIDALNNILGSEQAMVKVLTLLTDTASYMLKMAKDVAALLSNCLHVTCLAHGIHRLAESLRSLHPSVGKLVSNVKKVFVKSPKSEVFISKSKSGCTTTTQTCHCALGDIDRSSIILLRAFRNY